MRGMIPYATLGVHNGMHTVYLCTWGHSPTWYIRDTGPSHGGHPLEVLLEVLSTILEVQGTKGQ